MNNITPIIESLYRWKGKYENDRKRLYQRFYKKYDMVYLNSIKFDKDLEDSIGIPDKLVNKIFMKGL